MQKVTQEELDEVIARHEAWLAGERWGRRACLDYRDLRGLDFRGADLRRASMRDVQLAGADLTGANLWDADTHDVDMTQVIGLDAPVVIPQVGPVIGWKFCSGHRSYCIAKLLIPSDAKRLNSLSRKCRASKAKVLAIYDTQGRPVDEAFSSFHRSSLVYRPGETVECEQPFDECRFHEGAPGIHFFLTPDEVESYIGVHFKLPRSAYAD